MIKRSPSSKRKLRELKELLAMLKEHEVLHYSDEKLNIDFGPKKPKPIEQKLPSKEDRLKQDEEVLFYSSPR